jgi:hypothetical protein
MRSSPARVLRDALIDLEARAGAGADLAGAILDRRVWIALTELDLDVRMFERHEQGHGGTVSRENPAGEVRGSLSGRWRCHNHGHGHGPACGGCRGAGERHVERSERCGVGYADVKARFETRGVPAR